MVKAVVRRPVLWLVVFALVSISGVYLLSTITVDMFPEIELPMVGVYTLYPGAGPEIVEKSVTDVLETALSNTGGIKTIKSLTQNQSSLIILEFEYGTDLDIKMNRVRENIDLVQSTLPENAEAPRMILLRANDEPVLRLAIRSDAAAGLTQNELRALAKNEIQDHLKQIDGTASVDVEGGQDAIVQVALSQNRLEAYRITVSEIQAILAAQNRELGAGSIVDGLVEYSLKTAGEYASLADIANTVVARRGADIRLQDVGEVRMGFAEENSSAYINGEPGVYLSVMKQSGANTVNVADNVYRKMAELRNTLPSGISLDVIEDSSLQIRDMINELVNSAVMGIILAVLILFLFFRSINSSIITGLSIPLCFLITLLAMALCGITINMMTLAGLILGLGMVVDSSIVVLESVVKFREKGEKPDAAAILGGEEVMSSIIASTLTTVCVFLPLFLFKNRLGIIGVLVQDLLFTIGISIVSSLLVALFLVPVLAGKWLPVHSRVQKPLRNPLLAGVDRAVGATLEGINRAYTALLSKALRHRLFTVLLVAVVFAVSVLGLATLDIRLMPDLNSDTVTLNIEMPLGTRYEDTKEAALEIQAYAAAEIAGAKSVIAQIGSGASILSESGNNTANITVIINLDDPNADSADIIKEKLRAHTGAFPNAVCTFDEGGLAALLGGPDIELVVRADDLEQGFFETQKIASILENRVPEVEDITVDMNAGLPQVNVNIDRQRAYNMGLSAAAVANEIAVSMNGVSATRFRRAGNEYDIVLRLAKEDRYELPDLGKLFVRSQDGTLFPVSNFAALEKTLAPVSIQHEALARVIHVTANVRAGNSTADTEAAITRILDEEGLSARFAGEEQETRDMMQTFVLVITLALLLVFGVMAAQYESFRDPFINFCTIPLILIGVAAIHLITRQPMNAFTMIGFVMLAGIVVNNGIILVDYTNLLVRRGVPVMRACRKAGRTRFRPVLMTALTTMLGLAPMAFLPGNSSEMTAPIGLAVFGGLASATVITLFFIPVLYSLVNGKETRS
jgi:HAE1 family hydrophobic/amphiphilic exporter-1